MPHSPGKFCLDQNLQRWSLLNGVITRKTKDDPPEGGQNLPVEKVTAVEKNTFTKVERLPFGKPATLLGVVLIGIAIGSNSLTARILCGLLGLLIFLWGVKRIPAKTTVLDAYQIVAPGTNPAEWRVVGSAPELIGFVQAVKVESSHPAESVGGARG